jgi:DNA polymerase-4/protein ImuB
MRQHLVSKQKPVDDKALTSIDAVCLWIPTFCLHCEARRRPELTQRPIALLSPTDTRRLWQISAAARRAGVRSGMTVSQAIGLCPSLTLYEPDPVHYDEEFTGLLLSLEDVSPVVEPVELGRVFVGVDGLGKLLGGPAGQLAAVSRALAGSRHWPSVTRLGWARGKFAAWVAATRATPGSPVIVSDADRVAFLASRPVAVLPISADTHRRLRQLGLESLADVARLPETALISQFGAEGKRAWQLAAGATLEPVVGRVRPDPIVVALDFPDPVADRAILTHAFATLIDRALHHPRRTGWRVCSVRVRAQLEHGASWLTEVTLKDPSADCARIAAPLNARLEQHPPAGAVEHLIVEFLRFARGTDELQLFARDATSAARAGRQRALHAAAHEIKHRFNRPLLHHVVEVQPWSRIPERRYALIDFEP